MHTLISFPHVNVVGGGLLGVQHQVHLIHGRNRDHLSAAQLCKRLDIRIRLPLVSDLDSVTAEKSLNRT